MLADTEYRDRGESRYRAGRWRSTLSAGALYTICGLFSIDNGRQHQRK